MISDFQLNAYIRSVALKREKVPSFDAYPFQIPAIQSLETLDLHPAVTFLVGENGTGKSTLLEAIAIAAGYNAEGGSRNFQFSTEDTHSELHNYIRLVRGVQRPKDGFFLRAESTYYAATYIEEVRKIAPSSFWTNSSLHLKSHGESFMEILQNRFWGNGLYLLDEPEAALSPTRQMAMLTFIHDLVKKKSQFIIATHSPIILAYPNACIYVLSGEGIQEKNYEETEHYTVTRDFFVRQSAILNELLAE